MRTQLTGCEDIKVSSATLAKRIESLLSDVRAGVDKGPTESSRRTVERLLVRSRDGAAESQDLAAAALAEAARVVVDEWPLDSPLGAQIVETSHRASR